MELNLEHYYGDYKTNDSLNYYSWGWTGQYYYPTYYPVVEKTEQAYSILKKLVEKKIVCEPKSYKEFCELLDGIKEAL